MGPSKSPKIERDVFPQKGFKIRLEIVYTDLIVLARSHAVPNPILGPWTPAKISGTTRFSAKRVQNPLGDSLYGSYCTGALTCRAEPYFGSLDAGENLAEHFSAKRVQNQPGHSLYGSYCTGALTCPASSSSRGSTLDDAADTPHPTPRGTFLETKRAPA